MNFRPITDDDNPILEEVRIERAVVELANVLMDNFGLIEAGWTFHLTNAIGHLGQCDYTRKRIEFSRKFLKIPATEIQDTLLHEIAHALVGSGAGHGPRWKAAAKAVGCRPQRCAAPNIQPEKTPYNFYMKCPDCGRRWERYRMRKRNFGSTCPYCGVQVKIFRYKRKPQ